MNADKTKSNTEEIKNPVKDSLPANQPVVDSNDKFVSIATYARLSDVEVTTIHARLDKNDPKILQLSKVPGVEGMFINIKIYPPIKYKRGWKKGNKRKKDPIEEVPEKITDINFYVKLTVELAQDHIKDIAGDDAKKKAFGDFLQERYKKVADQVTFEEFCKLIKNFK